MKHMYDFDCGNAFAFLQKYGLEKEYKFNIETNHATLAGHTLSHEVAYSLANHMFGSIDANEGDLLLGWDTDEFPIHATQYAHALYLILSAGGFKSGGFNKCVVNLLTNHAAADIKIIADAKKTNNII